MFSFLFVPVLCIYNFIFNVGDKATYLILMVWLCTIFLCILLSTTCNVSPPFTPLCFFPLALLHWLELLAHHCTQMMIEDIRVNFEYSSMKVGCLLQILFVEAFYHFLEFSSWMINFLYLCNHITFVFYCFNVVDCIDA